MINPTKLAGAFLLTCGFLSAQALQPDAVFFVSVTSHTTKAVDYQHRSGATTIGFEGTSVLPLAHGEAKVESKQGYLSIDAEFRNLQPATKNGIEYLTYVLWAVTPEGRTANLGEVLLNGTNSKLHVTSDLQVFALIVTAEPYFAVTQPSDLVIMENVVRPETKGKVEEINAKYELLQRGQYEKLANPLELKADKRVPLELYEARNAVSIARSIGADRVAADTFMKAQKSLAEAEAYQKRNAGRKPVAMSARNAVQMAEDARVITVKRQAESAVAAERQRSEDRATRAESKVAAAESETDRANRNAEEARLKAHADSARLNREKDEQAASSAAEADRIRRETDARAAAAKTDSDTQLGAARAEADRVKKDNDARAQVAKSESDSRLEAAGNDADKLKRDNDARANAAKADSDSKLAASGAESDRLRAENEAQKAANQLELDKAANQKAELEKEKVDLRTQLLAQFNLILQTRDTVRGLIVVMSDVLFDTGKFSLRPLAREKLAKVAGIVSGHPGLRLDVEGYTDSVGTDQYNQELSEHRGESVRDYLTAQGMASASVTTKGFGKGQPVATNETAEGRQQNRRVELVISGSVIGTEIGKTVALR